MNKLITRIWYLTCSLITKIVNFEHKNGEFGALKGEANALGPEFPPLSKKSVFHV
jgi:hypothetical protein